MAAEIIQATKAGGLPVSVKTRLGFYEIDEWRDWLKHVFEQDIANLSIHLRTRKEMSKVDAHWELIEAIKQLRDEIAPNTLLTINGDIPDRQTGLELAEKYGIDGVMIGRGIFHNPFAFEKNHVNILAKNYLVYYDYIYHYSKNMIKMKTDNSKVYVDSLKFTYVALKVRVNYVIN